MVLDGNEQNAADQQGQCDGKGLFRQFKTESVEGKSTDSGDEKRQRELGEVIPRGRFAPKLQNLFQPVGEQGQHRDDRAGLDDDVEQVALTGQPLLGEQ